jgi:hypothetical protein
MAARRGKRIAATREKQRLSKIKKEEAKKAGPKVWTPDKLKIDKSYVTYDYAISVCVYNSSDPLLPPSVP